MIFRRLKKSLSRLLLHIVVNQNLLFITSFFLGVLLAVSLHIYQLSIDEDDFTVRIQTPQDYAYETWLESRGLRSELISPDRSRYHMAVVNGTVRDELVNTNNQTEAAQLYRDISVSCLVMPTKAENARTIRNTWGQHCNKLFFFSNKLNDSTIPVVRIGDVKSSFGLLCESLHRVEESGGSDWVLVTTEDTFALIENLRFYLAPLNMSQPHYLGHAMRFWNQIYNWGEAGYVLSRGALSLLLAKFPSGPACSSGGKYWANSDWYLGKHMASLGVDVKDTRDHLGRGRFNGHSFRKLLFPGGVSLFDKYWKDSLYLSQDGPHCCSSKAITFHGILSNSKMYQLEYMFYHLRPFPYVGKYGNVPPTPSKEDPFQSFLTEGERLKNEIMMKWLDDQLMTTPENMLAQIKNVYKTN